MCMALHLNTCCIPCMCDALLWAPPQSSVCGRAALSNPQHAAFLLLLRRHTHLSWRQVRPARVAQVPAGASHTSW